jgi:hypothetical protein
LNPERKDLFDEFLELIKIKETILCMQGVDRSYPIIEKISKEMLSLPISGL